MFQNPPGNFPLNPGCLRSKGSWKNLGDPDIIPSLPGSSFLPSVCKISGLKITEKKKNLSKKAE